MDGQVNGIKETIYQIFDIVFPADLGNVALGINEYQELAESFRKLVDVAVEESDDMMNVYIADTIDKKDSRIAELNAQIIEKDAQLQEAVRKEEATRNNHAESLLENERLANTVEQLQEQNEMLSDSNVKQYNELADLHTALRAKDEQIAKLTEEINKPKANIVIPSQGKSANLQELMEAAKNKAVKSQMDLALSGQTFRGKVELAIPPSYGGNDTAESTFQDVAETIAEDNWVPATQVPELVGETPSQEAPTFTGLAEHPSLPENDGQVTWQGLKELEERIYRLEQSVGLA